MLSDYWTPQISEQISLSLCFFSPIKFCTLFHRWCPYALGAGSNVVSGPRFKRFFIFQELYILHRKLQRTFGFMQTGLLLGIPEILHFHELYISAWQSKLEITVFVWNRWVLCTKMASSVISSIISVSPRFPPCINLVKKQKKNREMPWDNYSLGQMSPQCTAFCCSWVKGFLLALAFICSRAPGETVLQISNCGRRTGWWGCGHIWSMCRFSGIERWRGNKSDILHWTKYCRIWCNGMSNG